MPNEKNTPECSEFRHLMEAYEEQAARMVLFNPYVGRPNTPENSDSSAKFVSDWHKAEMKKLISAQKLCEQSVSATAPKMP